ncbi:hypothetical protein MPEAHAMD_0849 [Methylobacterium frigidaeris]|uniref:Class I SAM-dependent methyltransferase n=3 Tax=Methylobacterium frigidaeris TaxID=2038277 RepID=A0AA37H7H3_9HYPH|nr:hypothetical protein MPEAHAMD_0849 [Methylobacterium frigidaeris]
MLADEPVFEWLIKTVRPETIVELGSWQGHSANHMADICKAEGLDSRIVCVDTFLGGPEHWVLGDTIETMRRRNGMPTILEAFLGNTVARGNEGRIFPFTVDTATGWQVMRDLGFKADLIYVDAGHAYHQVVDEVHGYLPRLNEGGVMFGDDYYFEPVARAAQDMAKHYGFSLGVLQRRKWVFMTDRLMQNPAPEELGFEIRTEPYPD